MPGHPLLDIGEIKCVMFARSAKSKESSQPIREPYYWKIVSKVNIDTLTNEHANALFLPIVPSELKMGKVDEPRKHVMIELEQRIVEMQVGAQILSHCQLTSWFKARNVPSTSGEMMRLGPHELRVTIKTMFSTLHHIPELLLGNHLLDGLYSIGIIAVGAHARLQHLVDLQAHKNPRMRILQSGGGTAGATAISSKESRDMRRFLAGIKKVLRPLYLNGEAAFINFPNRDFPTKSHEKAYFGGNPDELRKFKQIWEWDLDNFFKWS
ncbi:hypothetical protein F4680DRAFT_454905 [Xylaria scruposa]|nr:hypothetical protein F4680DRAFT_454905 [Xylaria scruposa]